MKWVIDTSGRFQWRPYYEQAELDAECERMVSDFLEAKYGTSRFPISTDDLTVMVERDTSDLDLYADLSHEGEDVEGLTDFFAHKKPAVRIARELSLDFENNRRLRTTLAHEYGHVRFHKFLWDTSLPAAPQTNFAEKMSKQRQQFQRLRNNLASGNSYVNHHSVTFSISPRPQSKPNNNGPRCRRNCIFDAPTFDWMEWQASYASGAILMPSSRLRALVPSNVSESEPLLVDSGPAHDIISRVTATFDVSPDAAQVRLTRLGILQLP
jgi:hypothetical protein